MSDKKKSSSGSKGPGDKTDKIKPPKGIDRLATRLEKVEEEASRIQDRLESENESLRSQLAELRSRIDETGSDTARGEDSGPIAGRQKCCARWLRFLNPSKDSLSPKHSAALGILAAFLLGVTLYLTIRAFQWRGAMTALRSEPGIQIFGEERRGFFGKRLIGLRDPLAPDAAEILRDHNVNPKRVELLLTEFQSLNTPYEKQRRENTEKSNRELRDSLVEIVGKFAESSLRRHDEDLEKITRVIFEARFPKEMESVEIRFKDGIWHFEGGLFDPQYSLFKSEAPAFLVRGTPHWEKLVDLTNAETTELRENIESINIFQKDPDGAFAHLPRLQRLLRDYDAVCDASKIPTPRLQIELRGQSMGSFAGDIRKVQDFLVANGGIPAGRFLPASIVSEPAEEGVAAHLKLITLRKVP